LFSLGGFESVQLMQRADDMAPIETRRLYLRLFEPTDLEALAEINRDPEVMHYTGNGNPVSREETERRLGSYLKHWREHGFGLRAAVHKDDRILIGFCGLQFIADAAEIEIGFRLAQQYWGQGLATEAATATLRHGLATLGLDRIVGLAQPANIASQRVLEKSGLIYEKDAYYYEQVLRYYVIHRDQIHRIPV
jgi:RimJ/RimL family protein N-acetyltransferase